MQIKIQQAEDSSNLQPVHIHIYNPKILARNGNV